MKVPAADSTAVPPRNKKFWAEKLAPFRKASNRRAFLEIATTLVPFVLFWALAYRSLAWGYGYTLALTIVTGLFLVRIFVLQHEMGHGALFRSDRLNKAVGSILGVLTVTPFFYWRRTHSIHHATSGNLDRREFGDIDTITVQEYLEASKLQRLGYRMMRNPLLLCSLGAFFQFLVKQRFPWDIPSNWKKEWLSVHGTNLAMLVGFLAMGWWLGYGAFLAVHLPVIAVAATVGVWLFYVQHQFDGAYWARKTDWNFFDAALEGSSFYDLPRIFHWWTANIGYHHIHHLDSAIPCYRIRECMETVEELQHPKRFTFLESLACAKLKLWDEERKILIPFDQIQEVA